MSNARNIAGSLSSTAVLGKKAAKFLQSNSGISDSAAVDIVTAAANGSALDVGHWSESAGNWAQRWYGNSGRGNSDSARDSNFKGGMTAHGELNLGTYTAGGPRLSVAGALLLRDSREDPQLSVTQTAANFSSLQGGELKGVVGFAGTARVGSYIDLYYQATSWKAFGWQVSLSNTVGYALIDAGGYHNGGFSGVNETQVNDPYNLVSTTNQSSPTGQDIRFRITINGGTHTVVRWAYWQAGGDGTPTADKMSIQMVY